jgi:hypothetical protein
VWEIILPIVANIIQGGLAGGMSASAAARENNRQSEISRLRRAELQPIIDQLRQARDYFGVEENLVRDFSRSADQMAAQSAQTGMTNAGSGGLDRGRADVLGAMLAGLAQFKDQDDFQRQQLLAQLVGDPSLYNDAGGNENASSAGMMGALLGGAGGAGSALNAFIGTKEGLAAFGKLFQGSRAEMPFGAPTIPPPPPPTSGFQFQIPTPQPRLTDVNPMPIRSQRAPYYLKPVGWGQQGGSWIEER